MGITIGGVYETRVIAAVNQGWVAGSAMKLTAKQLKQADRIANRYERKVLSFVTMDIPRHAQSKWPLGKLERLFVRWRRP